jgi:hypothetical protein
MVRYARLGSSHGPGNKMSRKGRGRFALKFGHLQINQLNQSTMQIWCICRRIAQLHSPRSARVSRFSKILRMNCGDLGLSMKNHQQKRKW